MQATVVRISDGEVYVQVRRSPREQYLDGWRQDHSDLMVGDVVQVRRVTNSPYLHRVRQSS